MGFKMGILGNLFGSKGRIKKIDHAAIVVSDMDRSVRFYTEILGFEIMSDGRGRGGDKKTFLGAGSKALLALTEDGARLHERGDYAEGLNHLAFEVDNLSVMKQKIADGNIEFTEVKKDKDGRPVAYHFLDPDGLELEICADSGGEVPQY